ncbi:MULTISPECIES: oligosaccharide flippase family protein [Protofrankia]|uniref:Polysaccharide biosynthesis protein n=1 Tax=Candidatus Protofrankia datiscae TaxID=2716812 RepID=F8B0G0_9ACTN|nr:MULTISPECIES: oligosaccharide flippase family protein [Protofrankia]AEH09709.1 polysaccharide biosynthesis protein [Candidatus Protofrankia datiscae]
MAAPWRGDGDGGPRHPNFVSSALATWGTQLAVAVLSLANVLVVARSLGATGRGDVAFLTVIAYVVSQLSLLGVEQANVNFASAEPGLRPALATNSVLLALLLGTVAAGAVGGLIALFPQVGGHSSAGLRWLVLASVPMLILQVYLLFLAQADYAFGFANAAYLLAPLVNVSVNGLLAALGALSVGVAVAACIGGQVLGTALMAWYVGRRAAGFGRPDLRLARRSLGFGMKAHAGQTMLLANYKLDQWLVGAIAGAHQLGVYSVAVAWAEALFYLPTALAAVQRPDLVRSSGGDAGQEAAAVFRVAVLTTLLIGAGLVLAAPFLCVTVFGVEFQDSVVQLRVLTAGAFGVVALKLLGNALTARGKPLLETAAVGIAFVATVALDIVLIPGHGGVGASVASVLAYSAGGIAVTIIFARALGASWGSLVPRWHDARVLGRVGRRFSARLVPSRAATANTFRGDG